MLVAFHSSPYSAPLQTGTPNRGFELNVDILFTDSDSYDFVQASKCEFHINASNPGEIAPVCKFVRFVCCIQNIVDCQSRAFNRLLVAFIFSSENIKHELEKCINKCDSLVITAPFGGF